MQGLSSDDFMLPRSLPTSPTSPTAAAGTSCKTISSILLVSIIIIIYSELYVSVKSLKQFLNSIIRLNIRQ